MLSYPIRPFSMSLALILRLAQRSAAMPVWLYTKCLMVAPMPPFCTPLMYAVQMVPERCGSSEKLSKLCRKRGMHKRRSCGAAVLCSHDLRVDSERQSRCRDELVMHNLLTRWILQVGARIIDAALSFASGANSLNPTSSTRFLSQVAAKAVAHYFL